MILFLIPTKEIAPRPPPLTREISCVEPMLRPYLMESFAMITDNTIASVNHIIIILICCHFHMTAPTRTNMK